MTGYITPSALGLAVAKAWLDMQEEEQLLCAIKQICSLGHISKVDWRD
jgi:hypothetical protein